MEDITIAENLVHSATVANYSVVDNTLGQTKNLRMIGNGGGGASINANVLPVSNVHNAWNTVTTFRAAAPISGTWSSGDMVYNAAPAAGGFIGWVCVSAGTPGVWKGFGAIAP